MSFHELVPRHFLDGAIKAAETFHKLDNVLVAAHVNPDGDALGSISACGYILKHLGRKFALYSSTGIPKTMDFLSLPGPVHIDLADVPFEPETAIFLDCSVPHRLGRELENKYRQWPSLNIDHHIVDGGLGSLDNYIDPKAAATAQLVAYTALCMGIELKGRLAESLALGIMTDTGGFCHGNTSSEVFSLCALLAREGCDIPGLREKLHNNWSVNRVHLWGTLLSRISVHHDGKIAFCPIFMADMEKFHCYSEDLEGLVEWVRKIGGVRVAVTLREDGRNMCKFSLRSFGETDVRAIADSLGGGGHHNAAGGTLHMSMPEAARELMGVIARSI